ncbi:MAG: hypothetical protein VB138_11345 [Burkholderia sp.]
MSDTVFVGIDVSSQTLEIAISTQTATWQATNDTAGIGVFAEKCDEFS